MLSSLYISSFIIIDKMQIDFHSGMSVLTGETGAGKSIVIDALGQLCGQRASINLIKKNADKAVIEGVFNIEMNINLEKICNELHIEIDDQFVITKEILKSGKSIVKINYRNASNNALKIIMPHIIDIHSQFETQKLFEEKNHIELLDTFAGEELNQLKKDYTQAFLQYKDSQRKLKKAIEDDLSDEQLEFLESQLNEIDQISYNDNEVDELENEFKVMQNYEKVNENIQQFDQAMNSSQGVLSLLNNALYSLKSILEYGDFQKSYDRLYNLYYHLMDEYENIMDLYHSLQFDEYRFEELQEILFLVNRLKRKYGLTMERVYEYRDEISEKIEHIHHREEFINELKKQADAYQKHALNIARQMHEVRLKNIHLFEKRIQKELADLYMDKAIFKIHIEEIQLSEYGIDKIKFMVSTNKGQSLSLLNESASGGEISRIMLAIKTVILTYDDVETIIFDEVDTGVSGKVASSIGDKMRAVAQNKQVLCITHLPQVACLAQNHYCVCKTEHENETIASIELLDENQRIIEIAKMLSGEKITQEAINNAKQLLSE